MRQTPKARAFILLETLMALTIMGIALGLFWQARLFQLDVDAKVLHDFAETRLLRDVAILRSLDALDQLDAGAYAPLAPDDVQRAMTAAPMQGGQ